MLEGDMPPLPGMLLPLPTSGASKSARRIVSASALR